MPVFIQVNTSHISITTHRIVQGNRCESINRLKFINDYGMSAGVPKLSCRIGVISTYRNGRRKALEVRIAVSRGMETNYGVLRANNLAGA